MDVRVTVKARPVKSRYAHRLIGTHARRKRVRVATMPTMALLTEPGHLLDKEFVMVRAMRRVTVGTVIHYRLMLEQERPALLGVAFEAFVVYSIGGDQLGGYRAVWVVAV